MYQGFEIIDFHAHFPTNQAWFSEMGDTMKNYTSRISPERLALIREKGKPYGEHWRRMWGFPQPEKPDEHPGDEEQARRWVAELDKYGIRAIGFVTGGGNEHLSEICSWHPDRFVGFVHHSPFVPNAVEKLEHGVKEL
ncbi:MAG: hypothetical protein KDE46_17165, partial [Caldilineaceae bacterium]|nr:hypothetical protein [Caldilineaceae bacterium]